MVDALAYDGYLEDSLVYFARAQTWPVNTAADGNGGSIEVGKTLSGIEVVLRVGATPIVLADTENLWAKIQDSADDSSFADVPELDPFFTHLATAETTYAAGAELARFMIPTDIRQYAKLVLTSDDAALTGTVDCIVQIAK